jgi:hypothetical protein
MVTHSSGAIVPASKGIWQQARQTEWRKGLPAVKDIRIGMG